MPGQHDRNRQRGSFASQQWRRNDEEPVWREEDRPRYEFGRGEEPPRDDRGRYLSEGERGPYYGGADFDDYGDRHYAGRYEDRDRDDYERNSTIERQFGAYRDSYDEDRRLGGRDQPRDQDYFRGSRRGDDESRSRGGRSSLDWREQDYDDRRGVGQARGRYGDPLDQGDEPRERWQGSGGSRWDENDYRGRQQQARGDHRGDGRERDDQGRFTRDEQDDRRGGDSQRVERHQSDHRGWFGDSRGHSQAARRGWRHRGH